VERTLFIRRALAATLTAAAALTAHGGPALILDPRWTIVAGGTALAVTALGATAARYLRTCTSAPDPPTVWVTAGVLLAAQMAAHCLLILGGVHSGVGVAGALALHASLALVVAVVIHATDSWLESQLTALARALAESLQTAVLRIPSASTIPRLGLHAAAAAPRAPPARA
jgi:hypothetical protein